MQNGNQNPPDEEGIAALAVPILESRRIAEQKREPDEKDKLEFKTAREREEIYGLRETRTDRRANRVLRFKYARAVYRFLGWYAGGALGLLMLDGFDFTHFHLPDVVLTAIVGSTAAAAIGLVGFVVQGLFRSN